ncbi:peptidoglycan editing factor PgeF [Photobacterium frigidiphilum]|uniref:peptidoglycan editing factor PgeF n=1 Tax=Photobacterium frigidiphilum TaxID=264736 RepID=UPI003D12DD33
MWIIPDWPAPKRVKAISTTRKGGVSLAPYDGLNLGLHVGDDTECVQQNRSLLQRELGLVQAPAWLNQIHSSKVIDLKLPLTALIDADGSYSRESNLACIIMTADCLPVLLCDKNGTQVAAVHAGWRGLAGGVIEAALDKFSVPANEIMAWLGPAIGPTAFEVGGEVRQQFMAVDPQAKLAFTPQTKVVDGQSDSDKWLANIYLLATQRLQKYGITQVYGGDHCTVNEPELFYSYRREPITGRQASLIWLD